MKNTFYSSLKFYFKIAKLSQVVSLKTNGDESGESSSFTLQRNEEKKKISSVVVFGVNTMSCCESPGFWNYSLHPIKKEKKGFIKAIVLVLYVAIYCVFVCL